MMHPDFFTLPFTGIGGEIRLLNLPQQVNYFSNLLKNIILSFGTATHFIQTMGALPEDQATTQTNNILLYSVKRTFEDNPLDSQLITMCAGVYDIQNPDKINAILKKLQIEELCDNVRKCAGNPKSLQHNEDNLLAMLGKNKNHIGVAAAMLLLDATLGHNPVRWLDKFTPPAPLAQLWAKHLFLHYVQRGMPEEAIKLWDSAQDKIYTPYTQMLLGSMYDLSGDTRQALANYGKARLKDPLMAPLRYRMAELEHPIKPDTSLLSKYKTMICMYSWNQAELLEQTVRSLAASDIGTNPVRVLLNGCTDDSKARVEALRGLFPNNDFDICDMPINIGAPAARNWLLALPETRSCEFVAFLDDDVTVPQDWLTQYLTVMERCPKAGVVGGKIVHPPTETESIPRLQYIHRYISLAAHEILKLSVRTPFWEANDSGVYSYSRKCLNVMGCLHLLRQEMIEQIGGFDLRFSPSQHDDIDHDLCAALAGWEVIYCGTVTVMHHKMTGTGGASVQSMASRGSGIGNDLKLCYKHAENAERLLALSQAALDAPALVF